MRGPLFVSWTVVSVNHFVVYVVHLSSPNLTFLSDPMGTDLTLAFFVSISRLFVQKSLDMEKKSLDMEKKSLDMEKKSLDMEKLDTKSLDMETKKFFSFRL